MPDGDAQRPQDAPHRSSHHAGSSRTPTRRESHHQRRSEPIFTIWPKSSLFITPPPRMLHAFHSGYAYLPITMLIGIFKMLLLFINHIRHLPRAWRPALYLAYRFPLFFIPSPYHCLHSKNTFCDCHAISNRTTAARTVIQNTTAREHCSDCLQDASTMWNCAEGDTRNVTATILRRLGGDAIADVRAIGAR